MDRKKEVERERKAEREVGEREGERESVIKNWKIMLRRTFNGYTLLLTLSTCDWDLFHKESSKYLQDIRYTCKENNQRLIN